MMMMSDVEFNIGLNGKCFDFPTDISVLETLPGTPFQSKSLVMDLLKR